MKEYKDYAKITAHFDLAIEEAIKFGGDVGKHAVLLFETMRNELDTIPAADVVEVVRCRGCLCYTPVDDNTGKCVFLIGKHQYVVPDGYCYLGERKKD